MEDYMSFLRVWSLESLSLSLAPRLKQCEIKGTFVWINMLLMHRGHIIPFYLCQSGGRNLAVSKLS